MTMENSVDRFPMLPSPTLRRLLAALTTASALVTGSVHAATNQLGSADGSFESGLGGTSVTGDATLVPRIGMLTAIEGDQSLLLTTEPDFGAEPADADVSTLVVDDFIVPPEYATLRLTYDFLTDEPDPSFGNDTFEVTLVMVTAGGEEVVLASDTFDDFVPAPWTGYALQTGFRTMIADVSGVANGSDLVRLELRIADVGDGRGDSAVLVDDLRLVEPGAPEARVSANYLHIAPGQGILFDATGSVDDVGIVDYAWDFGNGYVGSGPLISFNQYTEPGFYQGTLTVTDADGNSDTATFSVVVGDINSAPVIVSAPNVAASEGVPYRYRIVAEDAQAVFGDVLTYELVDGPAGMSVDSASGLVTWTPPTGTEPRTPVTVRAVDSLGAAASQSYVIALGPEVYVAGIRDDGILYTARSLGDGTFDSFRQVDDVGSNSRGVAVADFDGDNDFDVVAGQGNNPRQDLFLYRRDAGGFETPVYLGPVGDSGNSSGGYAEDMAAEDFDNDGRMDLVVNGDSANAWLLENTGPLVTRDENFFASNFETGDDGWGGAQGGTTFARDDSTASSGNWSMRVAASADGSALSIDINPSGWLLAWGSTVRFDYRIPAGTPVGLLFNVSGRGWIQLGGTTAAQAGSFPVSPLAPTLVDDGAWHTVEIDVYQAIKAVWPDATTLSEFEWWTNGNGAVGDHFWFDDFRITRPRMTSGLEARLLSSTGGNGRGMDAGDANRDGNMDLVRARTSSGYIYLYLGDGEGNLTPTASQVADPGTDPYGVVLADFDNDGVPDILASNGGSGDPYLFRGNGDGTFQGGSYVASLDTGNYTSYGAFDFDGDGNQDVVTANYTGRQLRYFPGNGDGTFGPSTLVGTAGSSMLAVAAPAGWVIGQPFARATQDADSVDEGTTVSFDASDSYDDGDIVSYEWDFGDGDTATGVTATHSYASEGIYTAVLTVTDDAGNTDSRALTVTVNGQPPVAEPGGPYVLGEGRAIHGRWHGRLDGSASSDAETGIARYEWDFDAADGQGVDATGALVHPAYTAPGIYTVTLTVYDAVGQSTTATTTVTVQTGDLPTADLAGPASLDESAATLATWTGWYDASASTDAEGVAGYSVDWGDGSTSALAPQADDFDDGNLGGWSVNGGSWGVSAGQVYQTDTGNAWRWLQDLTRSYRDFELEVDVRALPTSTDGYIGLVFRNANASGSTDTFLLYSRESWDFWRFYDWQTATTLAEGGTGWDPEIWYHLRLRVVGDTMQLYVTPEGGTESLQVETASPAHPEGGIGLLAYAQNLRYDNVKVTPLDAHWTQDGRRLDELTHGFGATGAYDVALTVTDHAGQVHTANLATSVTAGAPPVADAGGPYVLNEGDAHGSRWDMVLDAAASSDDTGIERYTVDFGDGTVYTSGAASGSAASYFAVGTDLYGFDTAGANLARIVATQSDTLVEIIDLADGSIIASNTLNRMQTWNNVSPGDGRYFKVRASKPVAAYFSDLADHSAFVPSLDGQPTGREFIFHLDGNAGFYVFAHQDAEVTFFNSSETAVVARLPVRAGTYRRVSLGDGVYRAVASGDVAMQTTGGNGYTAVPSESGDGAGRTFYFATVSGTTGAIAAFAHDDAHLEVFDMDTGASLYVADVTAGTVWYQNGVGSRRLRLESSADIEVWAGDTEGGTAVANLGDDVSFAGGRGGTEFVLHNLQDGIVIFAPNDGTEVTVDGAPVATLQRDDYLALAPGDFAAGSGVHRIVTSEPVVIQSLGRANGFNDLGSYLGGGSMRHRYEATGLYTVTLTVTDRAGQTDTATTTVEVLANDPPVPNVDAPAVADESYAVGGQWSVDFDASGSTDDYGIHGYEWDFGDGTTGTGATVTHIYDAPGSYEVTLTVTDHAGQAVTTTFALQVTLGSGPVADAGGPYVFGEESASHGVWTAVLDGRDSSDDAGIFDYEWRFAPQVLDDFADGVIDAERWTVSASGTESGGRLSISGVSNWAARGFYYAGEPLLRKPGSEVTLQVLTGNGNMMVGLFPDDPPDFNYTRMSHALYFTGGGLRIYESGSYRGAVGSYAANTLYDVRIVLRTAGADYFIRPAGTSDWTALTGYSSRNESHSRLRVGASVYSSTWQFGGPAVTEVLRGPVVAREYLAPGGGTVTLRVRDNALQEAYDTTTITVEAGEPPVAEAGGPLIAEVGSFVAFNGSGSSDDNAVQHFDWRFGETTGGPQAEGSATADLEYTGRGPNPRHFYKSPGNYPVELTVTDNVGQTSTDTTSVEVVVGEPPVAAARMPSPGAAGGPPVYFDATPSSDDFGIVEYRWDFDATVDRDGDGDPTNDIDAVGARPYHTYAQAAQSAGALIEDTFDGDTLDGGTWLSSGATQSGGLATVTGAGSWGNRYLASQETFNRDRLSVTGRVRQIAGGSQNMMFGVKNANTTNFSYTQMPHAVYFNNGALQIYEAGSNRGTVGSYTVGVSYDVRIDLLPGGARYYLRESGSADWNELTGYTPLNRTDAPLRLFAVVANGTTELDDVALESRGGYQVTLTVEDGAGQTSTVQQTVEVAENLPPDVVTVPWVAFDPLAPHETYNGKAIRLKGIVRDADPATFQWDFGDGTTSPVMTVTNAYDLSVTHTYPPAPSGTPFTATLTVTDSAGNTGSAEYRVIVRPRNLTTEINVAIDEGLWYLHQTQTRSSAEGYATGYWTSNARASATASAIQAFQVNGHLESVDHRENPYAETVMRGLRQLFRDLGTVAIGTQTHGEPDTNGNGIGIETGVNGSGSQPIYQGGQVMDAIASSGNPLARTVTGSDGIRRRRYFDVLTDMADQFAWGQVDSGTYQGGWRYGWNSSSDNSAAQWGAIGLLAAQDIFGIPVPPWVKEQNLVWLDRYGNPGWGYTGGAATQAGTPSGLVQMALDDQTTRNARWFESEAWMAGTWTSQYIINPGNRPYYPYYALTKAMRLAKPEPVERFAVNGFDWFRDPELGLARTLIDDQLANGQFPGTQHITAQLRSAWGVIILSRSLFVQPPVADAGRDRVWGVDIPLTFDGSGSFHLDPFRSLVKYEWDFDGDGTWDFESDQPTATFTYTREDYPESTLPRTITARLRVTDNNIPALSDTDTVDIIVAVPPHPPVAEPGGPYTCTAGLPCALDGSGSFDIDPTDVITRYEWDLDGFPFDYTSATGATPAAMFEEGQHNISLRVWDNGVLNDLDGDDEVDEDERLSDVAFTTVTAVLNLPPVADPNGPYVVDEGSSVTLTAAGSSDPNGDPITHEWDLNDDGAFDDASGLQPSFAGVDDGSYPVALRVSDGLLDAVAATSVTVNNVAPVVDAGLDTGIVEGSSVSFNGSFSDPGTRDTHTIEWDFGDGSGSSGSLAASHVYPDDGVYTVTLTVTDDDGGVGSDTLVVTVSNAAPVVEAGVDQHGVPAGSTVTLDPASFTDLGVLDTHTASIDWGDGSATEGAVAETGGSGTVSAGHAYAAAGAYTVTVSVTDDEGATGSDTLTVEVVETSNNPPVVDVGPDVGLVAGDTLTRVGSFSDPDEDTWTATVDYGDGSGPQPLTLNADKTFALSHAYPTEGSYAVTVTVTDSAGANGSDSLTVVVEPVVVEPPPAPSDLRAAAKSTKVQLLWTHVGAESYNVYRANSAGGPYTLIANTTSTYSTYLDEGLTNGVTYYYVVTSVTAGVESVHSNEVAATPTSRTTRTR